LNPDRVLSDKRDEMTLDDHRDRADRLARALEQSCAYGRQLWDELQAVREYLIAALPGDPRTQPTAARRGARPEGVADDSGWADWVRAYADVTSALAGPRGDSGHGLSEARLVEQERRA
jgi:thioesterase domain-containing protein